MNKRLYKKRFNVGLATMLAAGAVVAVAPQVDAALSFTDVKETNTHYANIMNLAERGIIRGYEDGSFRPGDSIKRGNAAHIIAEVIGLDTTNVENPNFKDISTKNSNYGAIAALANAGIISGFEDGTYRANDYLTRGQMAKIIANAFQLTSNGEALPFTDIENSQYKENIAALFINNVTTGVTATTFDAKSNVTRGQLASFVVRAEKVSTPVPTPSPTPSPAPVPTPTPPTTPAPPAPPTGGGDSGGGDSIPAPIPKGEFFSNLSSKLSALNVEGINNIVSDERSVNITASPSVTKAQLANASEDIIASFMDIGTTAILNSVTIGETTYNEESTLNDLKVIAVDLVLVLGFSLEEVNAVNNLAATESIWSALEESSYSGQIYFNFIDGTTTAMTISINEGQ